MSFARAAGVVFGLALPFVGVPGCDCATDVTVPPTGECVSDADCAPLSPGGAGFCRDGKCQTGLPQEGEGEAPVGEGEGAEGEGDEGEGDGGEGERDVGFVIAPTSLAIDPAPVGGSAEDAAQIVNTGDGQLTIARVESNNAAFVVVAPAVGAVVGVDGSTALTVRFSPTVAGAASAVITVTAEAGGGSRTLAVSSSAVQDVEDGALRFAAGPDDDGLALAACECKAPISPANVDIAYLSRADASTCRKPQNIACGVSDACAPCNLGAQGSARWRSGRTEQPRQGDVPWIVDEEIVHAGPGDDGDFVLSASIPQDGDCIATVASIGAGTNEACCQFVDCGNAFACYPYEEPVSCGLDCSAFAQSATANDCLARGPVLVRARVTIDDVERNFCATLSEGNTIEVARVRRTAGAFSITSVGNVDEVDPGDPCP